MKKNTDQIKASPLMGMERKLFEEKSEELRTELELRMQAAVDTWESSSEQVRCLRNKRRSPISMVTFYGEVTLRVCYGKDRDGAWVRPAADYLGIRHNQYFSPEMEERMAVCAVETGSYRKAAILLHLTWLETSESGVRSFIMGLAKKADDGSMPEQCAHAVEKDGVMIIMADGWFARHRGVNWGKNKKDRTLPERTHWHEIRAGVIFSLSCLQRVNGERKELMGKHVVCVPAQTSPYDFGRLLEQEAARMGLHKAKKVFFIMDGGAWLWNVFNDRFSQCAKGTLDFYHLSEHIHALGAALHGAGTQEAKTWCAKILHSLKHNSEKSLFKTLDELLNSPPSDSEEVLEAIRLESNYCMNHRGHMNYAENERIGVPIGSGSMESLCSQFQNRLKRTGQFWNKEGFAALVKITTMHWNGELKYLWNSNAA